MDPRVDAREDEAMDERKLMRIGGVGAVLGGIVCFTPLVVTLLASLGLAAWFGPVDAVFHIVIAVGVAALGYGAYRFRKKGKSRLPTR